MKSEKKTVNSNNHHDNLELYLVTGNDEFEIKSKVSDLIKNYMTPEEKEWRLEIIEPHTETVESILLSIDQCIQAILTIPFLKNGKVILFKGSSLLKDNPASRSDFVKRAVEKLLDTIKQKQTHHITLIITAHDADKRRHFFKNLMAIGKIILCDKHDFGFNPSEIDRVEWVMQYAHEKSYHLTTEIATLLTARIGTEKTQLDYELEKLSLFCEGNNITEEIVRDLVPCTRTGAIFDLSEGIYKKNLVFCLESIKKLLQQGDSPLVLLIVVIIPTVRQLLLAKQLMEEYHIPAPKRPHLFSQELSKLPDDSINYLPKKKDGTVNSYALGIAAIEAKNFSLSELINGFILCQKTYSKMLHSSISDEILLTQLIIRLIKNIE